MNTNYDVYYKDNIFDIPVYKSLNELVDKYNNFNINENIKINNSIVQYIQDREPFKNYENLIYKKIFYLICCFFIFFLFYYFFIFKKN